VNSALRTAACTLAAYAGWRAVLALSRKFDFRDKVVVITGGSRGLGLVLARQLAAEGAQLAILARDEAELDLARGDLEHFGFTPLALICDLTRHDDIAECFAIIRRGLGPVDVLINNAGIIQVGPLDTLTLDDFEEAMAVHFWAALYTTREVVPDMRRRGGGRIVNISSIGGQIAIPHLAPYSASKFALVGLSDGLRYELAKDDILVTTVCPGMMRTGSPRHARFKGRHRKEFAWFSVLGSQPLLSINAERAARQVIRACRYGRAKITPSLPAKIAVRLASLFPELTSDIASVVNRALPSPGGIGRGSLPGAASTSEWSPSALTILTEQAAERNNELLPPQR
jgi:short-subunit dehydrogenase